MSDYQVIKLSNGENLICNVVSDTDKHIEIESPLKMETISRVTKTGIVESLSLGKYYEFILKKMDGLDIPQPTEDELKAIEEEEKQELKDQMLEYIKNDVTIH